MTNKVISIRNARLTALVSALSAGVAEIVLPKTKEGRLPLLRPAVIGSVTSAAVAVSWLVIDKNISYDTSNLWFYKSIAVSGILGALTSYMVTGRLNRYERAAVVFLVVGVSLLGMEREHEPSAKNNDGDDGLVSKCPAGQQWCSGVCCPKNHKCIEGAGCFAMNNNAAKPPQPSRLPKPPYLPQRIYTFSPEEVSGKNQMKGWITDKNGKVYEYRVCADGDCIP